LKRFRRNISISSTTDNLSIVRGFIETVAKEAGFDDSVTSKIILAVDEACTNVIKHAYKFNEQGEINIDANFSGDMLQIILTDNGVNFDSDKIPEPDIKKYHQNKKSGGLGMFLMKKLMDDVKYIQLPNHANQVVLIKYIN